VKDTGAEVIQVHLVTLTGPGTTIYDCAVRNWVTWVEASLRPKVGMTLFIGKDTTPWTIHKAYTGTPTRMSNINSGWRVGGL
jgi:hypothetical protein